MSVTLDFAEISWIVGGACAICGTVFGAMGKLLLNQMEGRLSDRFKGLENSLQENKEEWSRIDAELTKLRLKLAEEYALKNDVRDITRQIEVGFERLYVKLDQKASKDDLARLEKKL